MPAEAHGAEMLDAIRHEIVGDMPHTVAVGTIVDSDEAVHWIPGQGLYAMVMLDTAPFHGQTCKTAIGGTLYDSTPGGAMHSRPIYKGDKLVVVLLHGTPDGPAVAVSRFGTTRSAPPSSNSSQPGALEITEKALQSCVIDKLKDGESWLITLENGSLHVLIDGDGGDIVFTISDGAQFGYDVRSGNWKCKASSGAMWMLTQKGAQLRSPNGQSYIDVTDTGVFINGAQTASLNAANGVVLGGTPGTPLPIAAVMVGVPGSTGASVATPLVRGSTRVFCGG